MELIKKSLFLFINGVTIDSLIFKMVMQLPRLWMLTMFTNHHHMHLCYELQNILTVLVMLLATVIKIVSLHLYWWKANQVDSKKAIWKHIYTKMVCTFEWMWRSDITSFSFFWFYTFQFCFYLLFFLDSDIQSCILTWGCISLSWIIYLFILVYSYCEKHMI